MYSKDFTPIESLMRGSHLCNLKMIEKAVQDGAEVNYSNSLALMSVIDSTCANEEKKKVINYLLEQGAALQGMDTLLSLTILKGNADLISFSLAKVVDPQKEEASLVYALQKNHCDIAFRLLKMGVSISNDMLEIVEDIQDNHIKQTCLDLNKAYNLYANISVHSDELQSLMYAFEEQVVLDHHICDVTKLGLVHD